MRGCTFWLTSTREGGEGAMGKMTEDDKGGHFEPNFS